MSIDRKEDDFSSFTSMASSEERSLEREYCTCQPLSLLYEQDREERAIWESQEIVPASSALNTRLCDTLQTFFPRSSPISIFLLHISQWELTSATQQSTLAQRRHYHASPALIEQVMVNVRRVMRADDQVLFQERGGAAIIFPDVDQQGAYIILERIYHSVCLLQAETLLPPLALNTTTLMGMGTYPEPASSLEQLLYLTCQPAHCFILRPAIAAHLGAASFKREGEDGIEEAQNVKGLVGFPFMKLPSSIPLRLRHLLPYSVATELRCAPVGRNHHYLTVAMADPSNQDHIQRLRETTGLTIFPVSCNLEELYTLLNKSW